MIAHLELECDGMHFLELCNSLLDEGNRCRFYARGNSMYPFIRDGDLVEVEACDVNEIRIGDVLLFRSCSGSVVVHRIIRKQEAKGSKSLVTQGDFAYRPDRAISSQQVLGRIICLYRDGRRIWLNKGLMGWLGRFQVRFPLHRGLHWLLSRLSGCF